MAEEKKLYEASFRGVPYHVTKVDLKVGRRTVVHEYPQRDKPYVEDIGRAARRLSFTAFVVGDDYIQQADKLIGASETVGPGTLIHPQLGEMKCCLEQASTNTFTDSSRTACVVLTAVESGELEFPKAGTDAVSKVLESADALEKSAIQQFCDSLDLSLVGEWVDAALSGDLLDKLGIISNADIATIFDKVDESSTLASKGVSLISGGPKGFATRLVGALGLSRFASSARAWSRVAKQLKNLTKHDKLREGTKALARAKAEEGEKRQNEGADAPEEQVVRAAGACGISRPGGRLGLDGLDLGRIGGGLCRLGGLGGLFSGRSFCGCSLLRGLFGGLCFGTRLSGFGLFPDGLGLLLLKGLLARLGDDLGGLACGPLTGAEAHAPPAVHAGGVGVQVAEGIRKARGQQFAQLAALLVREARRAAIGAGVL